MAEGVQTHGWNDGIKDSSVTFFLPQWLLNGWTTLKAFIHGLKSKKKRKRTTETHANLNTDPWDEHFSSVAILCYVVLAYLIKGLCRLMQPFFTCQDSYISFFCANTSLSRCICAAPLTLSKVNTATGSLGATFQAVFTQREAKQNPA